MSKCECVEAAICELCWQDMKAQRENVKTATASHEKRIAKLRAELFAIARTYDDHELRERAKEALAQDDELFYAGANKTTSNGEGA